MASNHFMNLAKEAAFAEAPAAGWVGTAVEDLGGHTPVVVTQRPEVMIFGQQGPSTRGRRTIERGATGKIPMYLTQRGMLVLLEATFGPAVVTELAPDAAYQYVFATSGAASPSSVAVQVAREMVGGAIDWDTFVGGQVEQMELTQGMPADGSGTSDEGLAKVAFDLNYARRDGSFGKVTPEYADTGMTWSGGDLTLQVGPTLTDLHDECLTEWALTVPTGLDFKSANACVSSVVRDRAGRGETPAPTLKLAWNYKNRTYYDAWLRGEELAMRSTWTPSGAIELAPGIKPSFTVDIAAMGLTGEPPKESKTEVTKQDLPTEVLWNHVDPMISITVVTDEAPA